MAITESRVLPAQFIEDLGRDYGKQLSALTQLPVKTSAFAPTVAAQDPLQTAAYQQATDATTGLGAYQPYLTKAGTAADAATGLTGTGAGTGAGSIASYMSPYQSDVMQTALDEYDVQAQKSKLALGAPGVAGVFGGGRHGIAEAEYQSGSDRNRAALQAQMLQQGYQQAQQARQQDYSNQLGIAGLQSKLGGGAQQLATQQITGLGTLGAGQQAQTQAVLDAQRQASQMAVQDPINRLNLLGSGVQGLMGGMGEIQTTVGQEAPQSSPLATALGVGLTGADIYSRLFRPKS